MDAARLESWRPAEDPPVDRDTCLAVAAEVDAALTPAAAGAAEIEAGRIVAALGLPHGVEPRAYGATLVEALADLPADLLALAGRRVRLGCRYPPRPAEVVATVADERMRRVVIAGRARLAARKAEGGR